MGYYQGDYYRGDYYQGVPLLGLLGGGIKVAKGAFKGAKKLTTIVKRALGRKGRAAVVKGAKAAGGVVVAKEIVDIARPPSMDEVKTEMRDEGGSMVGTRVGPGGIRLGRDGLPCAKARGGRGCPHRMNVGNSRALRRSIRRARGFAKLARKVMTFPISKPPRGRGLFKKSKR